MIKRTFLLATLVAVCTSGCGQDETKGSADKNPSPPSQAATPIAKKNVSPPPPKGTVAPPRAKPKAGAPTPAALVKQVIEAADTKLKRGDTAGAVKLYNQAMRMNPKGHVPFQRLCVHYTKANPDLALPHCREWFKREPHEPTKKGIVPILFKLKANAAAKK